MVKVQGQMAKSCTPPPKATGRSTLWTGAAQSIDPHLSRLAEFDLADYKVRILDGENGTQATTRVLIDTQNGSKRWSTVGASTNIIEASWRALADSVEYGLSLS